MAESNEKRPHFKPGEVIISPVTEADLISLSEGYYASFGDAWFDKIEPVSIRPSPSTQAFRFAERMKPWLREPHTRWTKATLAPTAPGYDPAHPDRVIGHAGWLGPARTAIETLNFWRKDATDVLGWREKMGWTKEYEEELWSGTDVEVYTGIFLKWDPVRGAKMEGKGGYWHLAPLWVVPEFQGRGVASLLMKDVTDIADSQTPSTPMYLEAMEAAMPIYRHFGYEDVEGEGAGFVMIRYGPPKEEGTGEKEGAEEKEAE
ncbi:uncharacterized protein BDZ99DRAFT_270022 [Mytilinidion resinicola]|uniref:N-acetyltransferase domain-containing protein n=1 Tax=Mytilinidion resinicola TaxID=574789 RepID=A0A6A6YV05_9PEZI|nr:uncharacterized protein BDZ99DRAFT_270022 [Mytilinidion resinicola]KAF2812600.1 hypothetical protein BDZ99DRAFT_270022 [Mytilinidion resinicola]